MNVFCLGLNHRTAAIELRECFAGHARSIAMLRESGCTEAVLLTTCNRVEVYGASARKLLPREIANALQTCAASDEKHLTSFYGYDGDECAHHLFRVASGLDSMVVGETEIF